MISARNVGAATLGALTLPKRSAAVPIGYKALDIRQSLRETAADVPESRALKAMRQLLGS